MTYRTLLLLVGAAGLFSACEAVAEPRISREYTVPAFSKILHSLEADLVLRPGAGGPILAEGPESAFEGLTVEVQGDRLHLRREASLLTWGPRLRLSVPVDLIESLILSGSGSLSAEDRLSAPAGLEVLLSGSGSLEAGVDSPRLDLTLGGSGRLSLQAPSAEVEATLSGSGELRLQGGDGQGALLLRHSGSGRFDGRSWHAASAALTLSGSGEARVWAEDQLAVLLAGSGRVLYRGQPTLQAQTAGSGQILAEN